MVFIMHASHVSQFFFLSPHSFVKITIYNKKKTYKRQQPLVIQILSQNRKISYTLWPVKMLQAIVLTCLSVISYSDLAL